MPLVELETDKIDLEVGAPQAGVLSRIDRKDGDDVKIGEVLGVIDDAGAGAGASAPAAAPASAPAPAAAPVQEPSAARRAESCRAPRNREAAARDADRAEGRRTAEVDLARVRGSGDAGRVMRRDVEQAAGLDGTARSPRRHPPARCRQQAKPAPPVAEERRRSAADRSEERVRMSKRRATIAKRLVEAQQTAAMLTTFNEVDMSAVMALRERHKQTFKERHGVGLGIASFFVKASIGALREFPRLNAEIQGDEMVLKHYYDIGVAVGASEGLVVPVLRDADRMSFAEDRAADSRVRHAGGGRERCRSRT